MKILKKFFAFWVVLLTGFSAALMPAGCSVSSAPGRMELPAGGIVRRSVFQDAKKNSGMLTFHGKSGDFSYFWFFDGASIQNPADQNLGVDLSRAGNSLAGEVFSSEILKIHGNEKHLIEAKTSLRIDFPNLLNAQKMRLYRFGSGRIEKILDAPLNQGKNSSVTLPVTEADGDFYLAAMDSSFRENFPKASSETGPAGSGSAPGQKSGAAASGGPGSGSRDPESGVSSGRPRVSGEKLSSAAGKGQKPKSPAPESSSGGKDPDSRRADSAPSERTESKPVPTKKDTREAGYCTLSIDCKTVLSRLDSLGNRKRSAVPADGVILKPQKVLFYEGETVFDVLLRETKKNGIQMEYKATPAYHSCYIEGIHNLYEFDCGSFSGWVYEVNGTFPNYGCSRYPVRKNDVILWRYTCDLGKDVGCGLKIRQK